MRKWGQEDDTDNDALGKDDDDDDDDDDGNVVRAIVRRNTKTTARVLVFLEGVFLTPTWIVVGTGDAAACAVEEEGSMLK